MNDEVSKCCGATLVLMEPPGVGPYYICDHCGDIYEPINESRISNLEQRIAHVERFLWNRFGFIADNE